MKKSIALFGTLLLLVVFAFAQEQQHTRIIAKQEVQPAKTTTLKTLQNAQSLEKKDKALMLQKVKEVQIQKPAKINQQ